MITKPTALHCVAALSLCAGLIGRTTTTIAAPTQAPQAPQLVNPLTPQDASADASPGVSSGEAARVSAAVPAEDAPASATPPLVPSTEPADANAPGSDLLGPAYMNHVAGIALRPPAGLVLQGRTDAEHLGEWVDEKKKWTMKLSRIVLPTSHPLQSFVTPDGKKVSGLLDVTAANLKRDYAGGLLLREDVTSFAGGRVVAADANVDPRLKGFVVTNPVAKNNVGLVAFRYTSEATRHLTQQAIIQANEQLYYVVTLTTPGSASTTVDGPEDPSERLAADSFHEMVDSVQLLDPAAIRHDQEDRLFRTRSFYVNLDANMAKVRNALFDEQWFRILQNGKDIGYTYITEDRARGIPRLDESNAAQLEQQKSAESQKQLMLKPTIDKGDGVLIGIRSRVNTVGVRSDKTRGPIRTDSESWFFIAPARMHEDWSKLIEVNDFITLKNKKPYPLFTEEFGSMDRHMVNVKHDSSTLSVSQVTNHANAEPINRDLPPYYLPQAIGHLLPRILPLNETKTYLFVSFMTEARELMFRYIDVGKPTRVTLAGETFDAVPVSDRIGLEGSLTVHYVSATPDAQGRYRYLGNENKESHIMVVATDAAWLSDHWKDANLSRPDTVSHPAPVAPPDRVLDVPHLQGQPESTPPGALPHE